jgi:hypothetical protein
MTAWREVAKGDAVMLKGKRYVVTKHKRDGKRINVEVVGGAGKFRTTVKAKAEVKLAPIETKPRERWATKKEAKAALRAVPAGDAEATRPKPRGKIGNPWETPADKIERKLDTILGAHLVGESLDEGAGYYVPPVDVTTIAAHVALFHGVDPHEYGVDDLLELHREQHLSALNGVALHVNHWHTKTRPEVA